MIGQALIWVVIKVVIALMSDGVLEVRLHYVTTYLAGEGFHVDVVEKGRIDGLAFDPLFLHSGGIG